MKVILSRKGIDSGNINLASPILPDGKMLSIPIPTDDDTGLTYADILYDGNTYLDILAMLNRGRKPNTQYPYVHLDPDIKKDAYRSLPNNWVPAFGTRSGDEACVRPQTLAQPGDIFLFFGRCRHVDEHYRYISSELHCIWGYMQVGRVLTEKESISQYYWHPHAKAERLLNERCNTLYLPTESLTWDVSKPGAGILKFSETNQLTLPGYSRAIWRKQPFYMPDKITNANRKNSDSSGVGLYYSGIWQELVLSESVESINWAQSIISGSCC